MRKLRFVLLLSSCLILLSLPLPAADTLPDRLSDDAFWKLVDSFSEASQEFPGENIVSNELKYSGVIRAMQKTVASGGVYLGVGPEQNFSYIAALRPRMAFIVDIRRQNMVEHLMYRALFELAPDRADFLSRLFSRKRPDGLNANTPIKEMMDAYSAASTSPEMVAKNLQDIRNLLIQKHGFHLTTADESGLEKIFKAFSTSGPHTSYASSGAGAITLSNPGYAALMTALDTDGRNWSYLATEGNYGVIRDMEVRNLIVPVVGDFAGSKAIPAIGSYLAGHGAIVSVFYVSNVETYLFAGSGPGAPTAAARAFAPNGGWKSFFDNVSMLPTDSSSTFIRFQGAGAEGQLGSVKGNLEAVRNGSVQNLLDLFATSK